MRIINRKFIMNTETVTVLSKGENFEIIVQHDQSGSAYGMTLSKNAYEQLRQHFVSGSLLLPKCKCGQNALPYKAQIEIDKCSRCGNDR